MIGQFDAVAAHTANLRTLDGAVSVTETTQGYTVRHHNEDRAAVKFYDYEDLRGYLHEEGLMGFDTPWTDEAVPS